MIEIEYNPPKGLAIEAQISAHFLILTVWCYSISYKNETRMPPSSMFILAALSIKPISCEYFKASLNSNDHAFFGNEARRILPGFSLAKEKDFMESVVADVSNRSPDKAYSVFADLNRDGKNDAILLGVENGSYKLISLLTGKKNSSLTEIFSFGPIDPKLNWMVVPNPKSSSAKKEYGLDIQFSVLDCKLSETETDLIVAVGKFSKPRVFYRLDKGRQRFNVIYIEH